MGNVLYKSSGTLRHFQIADDIIERWAEFDLNQYTVALYLRLSFLMQRRSTSKLRETTTETTVALDITRKQAAAARKELVDKKLALVEQSDAATGEWQYWLLNPETGQPLYVRGGSEDRLDFDDFTRDELFAIYESYGLTLRPGSYDNDSQIYTRCPFHKGGNDKGSLAISLANGSAWNCRTCNKKGKLYEFERQFALKNESKVISNKEAYLRILTRHRKNPTPTPLDLSHPLLPQLDTQEDAEFQP